MTETIATLLLTACGWVALVSAGGLTWRVVERRFDAWAERRRLSDEDREGMAAELNAMARAMRVGGDRADTPEAATHLWALADLMDDFAQQLRDDTSTLRDTQQLRERFRQLTGGRGEQ